MNIREGLTGTWFFEGFEKEQIDALLGLAQEAVYPSGRQIITEGNPAEAFYVLLAGVVCLKMNAKEHGELVVSTLRQTGETFGWSALVEKGRSTASVECLEESYVLIFRKRDLEVLFAKDPRLGYKFMKRLATLISRRLTNTRNLLLKEVS